MLMVPRGLINLAPAGGQVVKKIGISEDRCTSAMARSVFISVTPKPIAQGASFEEYADAACTRTKDKAAFCAMNNRPPPIGKSTTVVDEYLAYLRGFEKLEGSGQ